MSLPSTVSRYRYLANGVTVAFAFSALFLDNSHLRVVVTDTSGNDVVKTISTDYTVTGALNPSGGTVTFGTAPTNGYYVTISRVVPITQATDYVPNDSFPAETHETALDKLTMISQQLTEAQGRALTYPATEPSTTTNTLAPVVSRKNKLLGFDGSGNPTYHDLLEEWGVQEINLVKLSSIVVTHPDAVLSQLKQATITYASGGHILVDVYDNMVGLVSISVPSNLVLVMMPGVYFEPPSGMIFQVSSQIVALPDQLVFDMSQTPELYLSGTVHPEWFGVKSDGASMTTAINQFASCVVNNYITNYGADLIVSWGPNKLYTLSGNCTFQNKLRWKHKFNNCRFTTGYTIDFSTPLIPFESENTFEELYRDYRMINSFLDTTSGAPVFTGQAMLGSDVEVSTTDATVTAAIALTLPAGRGGVIDVVAVGTVANVQNVFRVSYPYVNVGGTVTTWSSDLMTAVNPTTLGGLTVTTGTNTLTFNVTGKSATNVDWYIKITPVAHHGL